MHPLIAKIGFSKIKSMVDGLTKDCANPTEAQRTFDRILDVVLAGEFNYKILSESDELAELLKTFFELTSDKKKDDKISGISFNSVLTCPKCGYMINVGTLVRTKLKERRTSDV